ncbi:MAG: cell division protein FtsQ/DivIB [Candidatus Gastranaerophilaceae bacterium]
MAEDKELDENGYNPEYIKTRINRNKKERSVRKANMWFRRLRFLLRIIFIVALMLLCYKLIRMQQWYMSPHAFDNVNSPTLEIINNKIVPDYYILAILRKTEVPKVPIYMYNTNEIKNNLLALEPVENVFIRRFWYPARLQIIIQEKTPIITIAPDEKAPPVAFFTKGGTLIGRDYLPLNPSFKTIKVLTYGTKGDDYRYWDLSKIEKIEKVAKTVKISTKEPLDYIDLRTPNDVYIQIHNIKLRVGELDDSCIERIKRISSIMPQIKTLDKKIKYIDLRWKDASYIKLEE